MGLQSILWDQKRQTDFDKARIIPDMHVHTHYCNHSTNTLKSISKFMKEHGLFCAINEHAPLPVEVLDNPPRMSKGDIKKNAMSRPQLIQLLEEYSHLHIHDPEIIALPIGLEVDLIPGMERQTQAILQWCQEVFDQKEIPLNHISLSYHYPENYSLFYDEFTEYIKTKGAENVIKDYFSDICQGIDRFHYDSVCHPGLIHFAFNNMRRPLMQEPRLWEAYMTGYYALLITAKKTGTALEINTSGIWRDFLPGIPEDRWEQYLLDCPNPHMPLEILKQGLVNGVKFVIGSDAHKEKNEHGVLEHHEYFDQVYDVITGLDIKDEQKRVYMILDRKPVEVPLK